MRVLYFTEKDSPHDQRFLRALAGTPHQVFALRQIPCSPVTPKGINELSWPEGTPDWSNWGGWQEGAVQFSTILAEVQPDLVHAGPVQGPALLTALTDFHPLVTMSWGSDLLWQTKRSPWMRFAASFTLDHTDLLLADCQTVAEKAVDFGFPQTRIIRFPWGVDLTHFSPENGKMAGWALRESLGWDDNLVIFCNRTWAPIYGVDVLAKAFVSAVREKPNLRLLLVGSGPQEQAIRQILNPEMDKVNLPGRITPQALPGYYCAADLFVSPSHCDGSSISLLEALACGRPVLVSDIPSNQEWVKPGEVGELFKDGNDVSLTAHLLYMAELPYLKDYALRARNLAECRANWEKNLQKLLEAYQKADQLLI